MGGQFTLAGHWRDPLAVAWGDLPMPSPPSSLRLFLPFAILCGVLPACSSSSSTTSIPEAGDGKYHPSPNGQRIDETTACTDLANAISTQQQAMMCVGTTQPCPGLLESQASTTGCDQYDEGAVTGCVSYYSQATTCQDLSTAIENCVVDCYTGS
jgi:hypothetical protein